MKRLLIGLAISAAAITGPAVAQSSDNRYQDRPGSYRDDDSGRGNMSARIEQLRDRMETGVQSGAISRREALSLRASLRSLTELERRYSRNGLTNEERQDLQSRLRSLRQEVARPTTARGDVMTTGIARADATTAAMKIGTAAGMMGADMIATIAGLTIPMTDTASLSSAAASAA